MPGIYKNAQVNIAGPSAVDCDAGFLSKRMSSSVDPLDVDWQVAQGQERETVRLFYGGPEEKSYLQPEPSSALATRSWILQERLLSPRVLYFGSKKMYWECCTNVRYEDLHFPFVDDFQSRDEVEKFSFNVPLNRAYWLRIWYCIAETYSNTETTYQSDRFPALSALAREFAKILKDEYIAGLWKTDLLRGLTWEVPSYMTDEVGLKDPGYYVAPSWSWASARKHIGFINKNFDYDISDTEVEILDVFVEPKTADTFGQLQRSRIKIRGRSFKARIRRGPDEFVSERDVWYAFSQASDEKLGTYLPDNPIQEREKLSTAAGGAPKQNESEGFELQFLYLGQFSGPGPNPDRVAIAVERSLGSATLYRRSGLLDGSRSRLSDGKDWYDSACLNTFEMI